MNDLKFFLNVSKILMFFSNVVRKTYIGKNKNVYKNLNFNE